MGNHATGLALLEILDIFRRESNEGKPLSQRHIQNRLRAAYGKELDYKTVRRYISLLAEGGYIVPGGKAQRESKDSKSGGTRDTSMIKGYYFEHEFTDPELRMLIDSIVFSRRIPQRQREDLVSKLEGLADDSFHSHVRHVRSMTGDNTQNKELFLTIELLDEAIEAKCKVRFKYADIGIDGKRHNRPADRDYDTVYTVSPYQMIANEGRYYLVCNTGPHDNVANYRIDRIVSPEFLKDEPARPYEKLKDSRGRPFDLEDYMRGRPYMYSGDCVTVRFRITSDMVGVVMETFGDNASFYDEDPQASTICVRARVVKTAMKQFVMSCLPRITVLEPQGLANEIRQDLQTALDAYGA